MEESIGHVNKGDVVVVNFPFTDGSDSKVRPALIIGEDRSNFVVCAITHNGGREKQIELEETDFQEGKLNIKSFINTTAITTVNKKSYKEKNRQS